MNPFDTIIKGLGIKTPQEKYKEALLVKSKERLMGKISKAQFLESCRALSYQEKLLTAFPDIRRVSP